MPLYLAVLAMVLGAAAGHRRLWLAIAATLVALLVERIVELRVGGDVAGLVRTAGWYGLRRGPQAVVVLAICAGAAAVAARLLRSTSGQRRIAAQATVALVAFALVRAVSLHQVDAVLGAGIGPVRVRHLMEVTLLAIVGAAAWRSRREGLSCQGRH